MKPKASLVRLGKTMGWTAPPMGRRGSLLKYDSIDRSTTSCVCLVCLKLLRWKLRFWTQNGGLVQISFLFFSDYIFSGSSRLCSGEYTQAIMPRFQWCEQTRHCCRGFLEPWEEKQTTVDLLEASCCIHMHLIIIDSIVYIDSQQQYLFTPVALTRNRSFGSQFHWFWNHLPTSKIDVL